MKSVATISLFIACFLQQRIRKTFLTEQMRNHSKITYEMIFAEEADVGLPGPPPKGDVHSCRIPSSVP